MPQVAIAHNREERNMPQVAIVPNKIRFVPYVGKSVGYRKPKVNVACECSRDHTPNAETAAAIEEGNLMLAGALPRHNFESFDEFWEDLTS
jgi:hypothetical protein